MAHRLPALQERIAKLDSLDCPQLVAQYDLLAALIEDCGENLSCHLPDGCLHEGAFALLYLEWHGNLLPEGMSNMGYTDDQAIVAIVLHKHREYLRGSPRGDLFSASRHLAF